MLKLSTQRLGSVVPLAMLKFLQQTAFFTLVEMMKKLKKVSLQHFELQAEKILEIPDRQSTEKEARELLKAKNV